MIKYSNKNVTMRPSKQSLIIKRLENKKDYWYWFQLSANDNLTWDIVQAFHDKLWNWHDLSKTFRTNVVGS